MSSPSEAGSRATPRKETKFVETEDRDYAEWKRLRLVIEHENTLVHHRLTWLTSPTVLFAALAFIASNWDAQGPMWRGPYMWLLIAMSALGISMSALVGRGLTHAQQHMPRLDRWWYREDLTKLTMDMLDRDMEPDGATSTEHHLVFFQIWLFAQHPCKTK
jgi:hypothetical protein